MNKYPVSTQYQLRVISCCLCPTDICVDDIIPFPLCCKCQGFIHLIWWSVENQQELSRTDRMKKKCFLRKEEELEVLVLDLELKQNQSVSTIVAHIWESCITDFMKRLLEFWGPKVLSLSSSSVTPSLCDMMQCLPMSVTWSVKWRWWSLSNNVVIRIR